jgi:phospholipid/cholesterol/gamma-HCH transport system permease protein
MRAVLAEAGALVRLLAGIVRAPRDATFDGRQVWRHARAFGVGSLAVVVGTAALVGGILIVQSGLSVRRFGIRELVGWGAGFGILRDVGPLMAGLVFSGRVGSRNAAELASMKVRSQFDGLVAMGLDPVAVVVAPRVFAMVGSLVALHFVGSGVAVLSAAMAAKGLLAVEPSQFWRSFAERTTLGDLASGGLKSLVFGVAVALVSSRAGLSADEGAASVGAAAKSAVVRAALWIVALDLLVARWV